MTYAVQCHGQGSTFVDQSCNCFSNPNGKPRGFDMQPSIVVLVGSWYTTAINAFLLRIILEEEMGHPTTLVIDEGVDRKHAPEGWTDEDLLEYNEGQSGARWKALSKGVLARLHACMRAHLLGCMLAHFKPSVDLTLQLPQV